MYSNVPPPSYPADLRERDAPQNTTIRPGLLPVAMTLI